MSRLSSVQQSRRIGRRDASDVYLRYEYFGLLRTQGIRWARAAWGFPYRICGWPR